MKEESRKKNLSYKLNEVAFYRYANREKLLLHLLCNRSGGRNVKMKTTPQ